MLQPNQPLTSQLGKKHIAVTRQPFLDRHEELIALERGACVFKSYAYKPPIHRTNEMQALANQLGLKFRYDGTIWPRLMAMNNRRDRVSAEDMHRD